MAKEEDIKFVATHYKRHAFSADKAWKRLGIAPRRSWTRFRTAAAVAAIVALAASATIVYRQFIEVKTPKAETAAPAPAKAALAVKVIDFEQTPLPKVVERIKEVYGVEVTGVPENPEEYVLSLRYEGNVRDLVDAINEILGTKMKVKEQ